MCYLQKRSYRIKVNLEISYLRKILYSFVMKNQLLRQGKYSCNLVWEISDM